MSNVHEALKSNVDIDYFKKKLESVIRNLRFYTRDELARELMRLANTTSEVELEKCESETSSQPVGYLCESPDKVARIFVDKPLSIHGHTNTPLYDKPQPRDWVGLSDDEIHNLYNSLDVFIDYKDFARAIIAKLKQLNTKG